VKLIRMGISKNLRKKRNVLINLLSFTRVNIILIILNITI